MSPSGMWQDSDLKSPALLNSERGFRNTPVIIQFVEQTIKLRVIKMKANINLVIFIVLQTSKGSHTKGSLQPGGWFKKTSWYSCYYKERPVLFCGK